jgi:hypothetical protein
VNTSNDLEISDSPGLGVVLELRDRELADHFEDYLTEKRFVFFKLRDAEGKLGFLFGEASSPERVRLLFSEFTASDR